MSDNQLYILDIMGAIGRLNRDCFLLLSHICFLPFAYIIYPYNRWIKIFSQIFFDLENRLYKLKSFLSRCTVLTETEHIAAVSRIDFPAFNERITLLYSSCLRSLLFTEPTLRPSLPPSAMYLARPLLRR